MCVSTPDERRDNVVRPEGSRDSSRIRAGRSKNQARTLLIGVALVGVALLVGWQLIGSWAILFIGGFGIAVAMAVGHTAPRIQLRGARELRYTEAPWLFDTVEALSRKAGVARPPVLYYADLPELNAATIGNGRENLLVVTQGLLTALPEREITAVLAHEIAHIKNNDVTLFRFAEVVRQATLMFTRAGWLLILFTLPLILFGRSVLGPGALLVLLGAPFISWLLQLSLFRTREFAADETASTLTGDPAGLASALIHIERIRRRIGLFVLLPPTSERSMLRTHPTTEERVARLTNGERSERGAHPGTERPFRPSGPWSA